MRKRNETFQLIAVGNDENPQVIDDAAIFILRFFLDATIVMVRHLSELKPIFGSVTSNWANQVLSEICDLKPLLTDELQEMIRSQVSAGSAESSSSCSNANKRKRFRCSLQCNKPEYVSAYDSVKSLQKFDIEEPAKTKAAGTFSMRYDQKAHEKKNESKTKYNRTWLLSQIGSDIIESLVSVLKSKKNNNELQNELIELLGFDKFDLLEEIFENRKQILQNLENDEKMNQIIDRAADSYFANGQTRTKKPVVSSQVVVQSEQEMQIRKKVRKDEKKLRTYMNAQQQNAADDESDDEGGCDVLASNLKLQQQKQILDRIQNQPILTKEKRPPSAALNWLHQAPKKISYPFVFDSQMDARSHVGFISGSKLILPESAKRTDNNMYEEVHLPTNTKPIDIGIGEKRVKISELDEIGQMAFAGTKELNRIQSVVFNRAYNCNDNLLVCAPTGAGKTNVAMLTIVNAIRSHTDQGVIHRDQFKIVYVAPMKALAAEMVQNFGKRLSKLGKSN